MKARKREPKQEHDIRPLLERMWKELAPYAKSDEETSAMLDRELGMKSLTEVLAEMREE